MNNISVQKLIDYVYLKNFVTSIKYFNKHKSM